MTRTDIVRKLILISKRVHFFNPCVVVLLELSIFKFEIVHLLLLFDQLLLVLRLKLLDSRLNLEVTLK